MQIKIVTGNTEIVPEGQSEHYLIHWRWGFYSSEPNESTGWPPVRSGSRQEEAGDSWASATYTNNIQSVNDGVVSKLGFTDLNFVDTRVKIKGALSDFWSMATPVSFPRGVSTEQPQPKPVGLRDLRHHPAACY